MSDDLEQLDEDLHNPFDFLESLGWHTSAQEDDSEDDSEDDDDSQDEWDEDVYLASHWMNAFSLGNWGQFADGVACDGSRDPSDEPESDELSLFDHIRLVMTSRRAARLDSQVP